MMSSLLLFYRVIESKNSKYQVGAKVFAQIGWRTHSIIKPEEYPSHELYVLPDFGSFSYSLGLGVLGRDIFQQNVLLMI